MGGGPNISAPPAAPPVPSYIDPAILEARRKARAKALGLRSSTILTGPYGSTSKSSISSPYLMGAPGKVGSSLPMPMRTG